jgi:4-nitrophenyl phosphatase
MADKKFIPRGLILDMDGVLWRDRMSIGDLPAIFETIEQRGYRLILATNNATLSASAFVEKLAGFGVHTLRPEQIVNTSQTVAAYLQNHFPAGAPVFVLGEQNLVQEIEAVGFCSLAPGADEQPVVVVVGIDRQVTFERLKWATLWIRNRSVFIGTNPDRTFPTPEGLIPGAGAFVSMIQVATDVTPLIIGKPEPEMYRLALARMGLLPEQALVVGDRLETDIAGAQRIGCRTGLVLSGVSTAEQAAAWQPAIDYLASDLAALLEMI